MREKRRNIIKNFQLLYREEDQLDLAAFLKSNSRLGKLNMIILNE